MDHAASASSVQWRLFLRALAEEVDSLAGSGDRDDMLRGVGARMARLSPLPSVSTLEALETEVNDTLGELGWGQARLELDEPARMLRVIHTRLPRIGSMAGPQGPWLSALLEGLYETWFAQQPGADGTLTARRKPLGSVGTASTVALTYGRN